MIYNNYMEPLPLSAEWSVGCSLFRLAYSCFHRQILVEIRVEIWSNFLENSTEVLDVMWNCCFHKSFADTFHDSSVGNDHMEPSPMSDE